MSPRAFRALLAVAIAATVAPLFVTRYPPFTDQPEHVAMMATLRHWLDPAFRGPEHYTLAGAQSAYLAYHAAGAALTFLFGDPLRASQVLLAAAAVAHPLGFRSLLRALGRDERLCIFACPLFYGRPLIVGLHPYVAAVPLALFGIGLAARQAQAPTWRRCGALAALALVVLYTHACAFVVLGVVGAGLVMAFSPPGLGAAVRAAPRKLAWSVPAVIALACGAAGGLGPTGERSDLERHGAGAALLAAPVWAHDIWRGHVDELLMLGFWACVLTIVALAAPAAPTPVAPRRWADPALVPLACTAVLFLVTPYRVGAAVMLDVRLAPLVVLFTLLPLAPRAGVAGTVPLVGGFIVALATGVLAAFEIRASAAEMEGFDGLLDATRDGGRLLMLDFVGDAGRTFYPAYGHAGAYHRARHGGVAAFSFAELAHWPLQFRPGAAPPGGHAPFWDHDPCAFRNSVEGDYYDHVLVRGAVDPFATSPPGPAWRVAARTAAFTLYEKLPLGRTAGGPELDQGPCAPRRGD